MNWLTFHVQAEPGFRFNIPDLVILLFIGGLSVWLHETFQHSSIFGVPPYLLYSFFLYCNVFRFSNLLEALWYLPFTGLALVTLSFYDLETFWWMVLLIAEPWKWMLIAYCISRETYIGVGFERVTVWRRRRRPTRGGR